MGASLKRQQEKSMPQRKEEATDCRGAANTE